jgi:2,3-bisphosphoglycerate-dependent phosphoglycerate mutase
LNRAVQTARIAFEGSGIPTYLDWRLRECNYGVMNGALHSQLAAKRRRWLDEPFPGGESWRQAVQRVGRFLRDLEASRDGKRVLLIGHVATHWALDHYVRRLSLEELVDAPFHWQEGWEYVLRSSPST